MFVVGRLLFELGLGGHEVSMEESASALNSKRKPVGRTESRFAIGFWAG